MAKNAVVLLSGGLDSATTLAIAKSEGYNLYALTFDYGQRNRVEISKASEISLFYEVKEHLVLHIPLGRVGKSALTGATDVPMNRDSREKFNDIPVTYVPSRNIIFLSFALSWAETVGGADIFIGANAVDYSGYPDCRPDFLDAFEVMANRGTKSGVEGGNIKIKAPLIDLSKAEIIKRGVSLQVDFSKTSSCYKPSPTGESCGMCDSCLLRENGFKQAGLTDPQQILT